MIYDNILSNENVNILITGDSLSYNRYSYDECARENAYNCGVGMESWSFQLRDRIYTSDPQFVYGDELQFNCKSVTGIANNSKVPYTAMFGGKIQTLYLREENSNRNGCLHSERVITFRVAVKSDEIVLYLQRRIDAPCVLDIYVDGVLAVQDVHTQGAMEDFAGYGLMLVSVPCNGERDQHIIKFANIRGDSPIITVAGVGAKCRNIVLNGKGGETARFFLEYFEERIERYAPDMLILSLTGNDRLLVAPEVLRKDLTELFSKIFQNTPECKVLLLLPPLTHNPLCPGEDVYPYSSLLTAEVYCRVAERVCENLREDFGYHIDTLRIDSLFDKENVDLWRYDDIHLTRYGNEVLLEAVASKLGLAENL